MSITNKDLKKRIIDISYKNKLAHIGSCLTAVDIIKEIFDVKKDTEKFVLSSGHAGLALYVVLEEYFDSLNPVVKREWGQPDAEEIFEHHGVHPDRCTQCGLDCSAGSLGQGLPIAVGMALADRTKNVYCLISDGECSEGSIYEALNVMYYQKLDNLKVFINRNGWSAYRKIEPFGQSPWLYKGLSVKTVLTNVEQFSFLKGQDAHYKVMNEEEYKQALEVLR